MKSLDMMSIVEKASLLHQLFPDEIKGFLQTASKVVKVILKNPETLREDWEGQLMSVEQWLTLARRINDILEKYHKKLEKSRSLFSDQLFDGYLALMSIHCLTVHKNTTSNQRFIKVVHAFFE